MGRAMTVSAFGAAKRLCLRSGWSLSNLQLQKLLYIAHMFHLGRTGEPLINASFEAWDYGPVVPQVYHHAKVYGSDPIRDLFHSAPDLPDSEETKSLDEVLRSFGDVGAAKLVAITHWSEGAWARYYQPKQRGITIPNGDILQEYRNRVNAAAKR